MPPFLTLQKSWRGGDFINEVVTEAYLNADKKLLVQQGFLGLGE